VPFESTEMYFPGDAENLLMRHWQSTVAVPDALDLREPLLVNAIGHSAGMLIFGLILLVLMRDRCLWKAERGWLAPTAALLAVVWNGGSLLALAGSISGQWSPTIPTAFEFAALSLLPAVLLAISLGSEASSIQMLGAVLRCNSCGDAHRRRLGRRSVSRRRSTACDNWVRFAARSCREHLAEAATRSQQGTVPDGAGSVCDVFRSLR
jgi:hypothetical protein